MVVRAAETRYTVRMDTRQLALRYGFHPNRALGQNFLCDEATIAAIVDASVTEPLPVLEIGPGLGALTGAFLARGLSVTAVEKDGRLCAILSKELPKARVIHADFLHAEPAALMHGDAFAAAANLPYYATTAISEKLLCALPRRAVLMVQKEAAARFFAKPGDRAYGPLAILSQLFYRPERLFPVPPRAFWPQPSVESAVLRLIRHPVEAPCPPDRLKRFCDQAFAMRRKTVANNFGRDTCLLQALETLRLPSDIRAEAVAPYAFLQLYRAMEE